MKLPLPVIRLLNPLAARLLRSRFHGLLSSDVTLLTFTGRKSGRSFSTPVSYIRDADLVRVFTPYPWWRNLKARPDVTVLLKGEEHRGRAQVVEDAAKVREGVEELLRRIPRDEPYYERGPDGAVDVTTTIDGKRVPLVMIEIRLAS